MIKYKGYVLVPTPKGHPKYVEPEHSYEVSLIAEHILVAEDKIGRYLNENESVHHLNYKRSDNRPENLVVVTPEDHEYYHKHKKKLLP